MSDLSAAPSHYSRTAVTLHWLIAILIITAFFMGGSMIQMPVSPMKVKLFNWHKWIGITVLGLAAARLLWRLGHRPPDFVAMPNWQRKAAHGLHMLLYFVMFAQPISGWLYSNATGYPIVYLGKIPLPVLVSKNAELAKVFEIMHGIFGQLIFLIVIVHILAALKHQFINKDGTLKRMFTWRGPTRTG